MRKAQKNISKSSTLRLNPSWTVICMIQCTRYVHCIIHCVHCIIQCTYSVQRCVQSTPAGIESNLNEKILASVSLDDDIKWLQLYYQHTLTLLSHYKYTNTNAQKHKYKYLNTQIQTFVHKSEWRDLGSYFSWWWYQMAETVSSSHPQTLSHYSATK